MIENERVPSPVNITRDGKSKTIKQQYDKSSSANFVAYKGTYGALGVAEPVRIGTYPNNAKNQKHDSQQYRIYDIKSKSVTLCGNGGGMGAKTGLYAVPVCVAQHGRYHTSEDGTAKIFQHIEARTDGRTNTLTTVQKDNNIAEPLPQFAVPCEFDADGLPIKAISGADGKIHDVYKVVNGEIYIKGARYPVKLADGFWLIRKLTVNECRKLQTVPEWYDFSVVSDSQAYRMLGNGWTVMVISFLIALAMKEEVAA